MNELNDMQPKFYRAFLLRMMGSIRVIVYRLYGNNKTHPLTCGCRVQGTHKDDDVTFQNRTDLH